jgi:2-oxoglutarate/2-oxoacid ferredoxin oxidoreductase subunit beta
MTEDIKQINKETPVALTAKDFSSDQEVRWCPGCGDYSVLAQVQRIMPQLGIPREKIAFIAGIGCSSRFPYYMNTYGFHGIHGRASIIASGLKLARPDLSVWVATGDGDLLSIGGNHMIHLLRKNIDINILLFNNKIYGLTKGQYSPTSEYGKVTKSSPYGTVDYPFNPIALGLGSGGTFVARAMDRDPKLLQDMIMRSYKHKGTSYIEIFQNCNIFNDGAWELYTEKDTKLDNVIYLEHGKPLLFGKTKEKGIKLDGFKPVIININEGNNSINDVLIHNEKSRELAFILSEFSEYPGYPAPVGVFFATERKRYEDELTEQINSAIAKKGKGTLEKLLFSGSTWKIE